MSAWAIVVVSVVGYLFGAVGTARAVFTARYKAHYPYWKGRVDEIAHDQKEGRYISYDDAKLIGRTAHDLTCNDSDVWVDTAWAGALWVFVLPYLLLVKPVGTVILPLAVKWFTGAGRKAVAS